MGGTADRTVTPDNLHSVLGLADVVVLAAPATPETTNLVDARFLAQMRPNSLLVNVARGVMVDEQALLESLDSGHLRAAILDVFREEPLPADHPFWSHPSVRVTPHNAAGGIGRLSRQADLFAENLDRYLRHQPLLHDVTDAIAQSARRRSRRRFAGSDLNLHLDHRFRGPSRAAWAGDDFGHVGDGTDFMTRPCGLKKDSTVLASPLITHPSSWTAL